MVDALHPRAHQQQQQQPEVQSSPDNARFLSPLTVKGNGDEIASKRTKGTSPRYMPSPSNASSKRPSSSSSSSTRRFPSPVVGRRPISTEKKRPDSPAPTRSSIDASKTGALGRTAQRLPSIGDGNRSSPSQDSSAKDRTGKAQVLDHTLKPVANGLHRLQESVPKKAAAAAAAERKATPERKSTPLRRPTSDQTENAKPIDKQQQQQQQQQAWVNVGTNSPKPALNTSPGSGRLKVRALTPQAGRVFKQSPPIRSLASNTNELTLVSPQQNVVSRDMLSVSRSVGSLEKSIKQRDDDEESVTSQVHNPVDSFSDCESVSSICSSATMITSTKKSTPSSRSRRLSDGDMTRASLREQEVAALSTGGKTNRRLRSLSMSVPISPGISQPSSPGRLLTSSPRRSTPSPTRTSISPFQLPAGGHSRSASFSLDLSLKGKKASQQEEAFLLRILHNRWLQWRFVNARADAVRSSQTAAAERSLCNAWATTSGLRRSVAAKRIELQQARAAKKLQTVLAHQGPPLESWCSLKHEHSAAVTGALNALQAAVVRVPATTGVKADLRTIKETLSFGVHVMNSMESLVTNLMAQAGTMEELMSDLATVSGQEKALLEECSALLDTVAGLEIEERSLKVHLLQREGEKFSNVSVDLMQAKL